MKYHFRMTHIMLLCLEENAVFRLVKLIGLTLGDIWLLEGDVRPVANSKRINMQFTRKLCYLSIL